METLKRLLRRAPNAYAAAQRSYYGLLYLSERLLGSRLHVWIWRYLRPVSSEDVIRSANHPHRLLLLEALETYAPLSGVLEVGCNAGVNLALVTRRWPASRLEGIDVSAQAVEQGRRWLADQGLDGIRLHVRSASGLDRYADGEFDVAFADAVMMYLGPDAIFDALAQMARIARKGVVLNEWSLPEEDERLHYWYDLHWVHNYPRILRQVAPDCQLRVSRIPAHVWGGSGWTEYGTLLCMRPAAGPDNRDAPAAGPLGTSDC